VPIIQNKDYLFYKINVGVEVAFKDNVQLKLKHTVIFFSILLDELIMMLYTTSSIAHFIETQIIWSRLYPISNSCIVYIIRINN
jgi:hypothetical protein